MNLGSSTYLLIIYETSIYNIKKCIKQCNINKNRMRIYTRCSFAPNKLKQNLDKGIAFRYFNITVEFIRQKLFSILEEFINSNIF